MYRLLGLASAKKRMDLDKQRSYNCDQDRLLMDDDKKPTLPHPERSMDN